MQTIKIKRLTFDSYIEICAVIGFLTGIISSIFAVIVVIMNMFGTSGLGLGSMLSQVLLAPILSGIGGLFTGLFTYFPYKLYMKLRKGTELKVISE